MSCQACYASPSIPIASPSLESSQTSKLYKGIVLVCSVALGAFALYTAPLFAAVSGSVGFVIGAAYVIYKRVRKEEIPDILARPTCALGVYDLFSRIPISMELSAIVAAFYFAGHIAHSPYSAAFFGVPIGMGLGKIMTENIIDLSARVLTYYRNRSQRTCCQRQ